MAKVEDTAYQVALGAGALIVGYVLVRHLAGQAWEFNGENIDIAETYANVEPGFFNGGFLLGKPPINILSPVADAARGAWDWTEGLFDRDWSLNWSEESAMYDAVDAVHQRDPAGRDVGINYR